MSEPDAEPAMPPPADEPDRDEVEVDDQGFSPEDYAAAERARENLRGMRQEGKIIDAASDDEEPWVDFGPIAGELGDDPDEPA